MITRTPYSNNKEDLPSGKTPNWRLMLSILNRIMLMHILCIYSLPCQEKNDFYCRFSPHSKARIIPFPYTRRSSIITSTSSPAVGHTLPRPDLGQPLLRQVMDTLEQKRTLFET